MEASKFILGNSLPGDVKIRYYTYVANLIADVGMECIQDLKITMLDRKVWKVGYFRLLQPRLEEDLRIYSEVKFNIRSKMLQRKLHFLFFFLKLSIKQTFFFIYLITSSLSSLGEIQT